MISGLGVPKGDDASATRRHMPNKLSVISGLERRTLSLNQEDLLVSDVIRFRKEVIRDAEAVFA